MTIPADSLPGDHLRAEELHKGREALCRFMREHPTPPISIDSVLSQKLEQCLCGDARDAVCLKSGEWKQCRKELCAMMSSDRIDSSSSFLERFFERLSVLSRSTFPRVIAGCCVLLILGNSVALAATETVPGDTLYPVKINLLEPAQAMITLTPAGKAAWASNCVRRRLVEAEHLIAQDRLTPQAWDTISSSIAKNTDIAERHIVALSKTSAPQAADLSADLHLALDAHGKVFADVARISDQPVITAAAADIAHIAASTNKLYDATQDSIAQDQQSTEETAMRVMDAASSAAGSLTESIAANADNIPRTARQRGDDAKVFLKNAQDRLQAGEFRESLRDARMAQQKTEEGNAFVRLGAKFDASDSDATITNVPLSVCGATVLKVSVPAVAAPLLNPFSKSKSGKKNHGNAAGDGYASVKSSSVSMYSLTSAASSLRSSAVSVSSSSSMSSSAVQSSSLSSSSSSSLSSSDSSASSVLLDILPKIPLLH